MFFLPQPPTVACKMEAQPECIHIAFIHLFTRLAPELYAQSVLINKISASEPSRKLIESTLLVGSLFPAHLKCHLVLRLPLLVDPLPQRSSAVPHAGVLAAHERVLARGE